MEWILLRGGGGFSESDAVKIPAPIRIGMTPGDPAGIGPEIILQAVQARPELLGQLVVAGDLLLQQVY